MQTYKLATTTAETVDNFIILSAHDNGDIGIVDFENIQILCTEDDDVITEQDPDGAGENRFRKCRSYCSRS